MWQTESYSLSTLIFLHLLGLIYFIAISGLFIQFRGLIGQKGILPLDEFKTLLFNRIGKKAYRKIPMLFWFGKGDAFMGAVFGVGLLASLLLFLGFAKPLMILILYGVYISIIYAGQDFLGFGWELFLIEITTHAFFLSLTTLPNPLVFISFNFLIFRFHFEAGTVKFESRDPNWRNLTALSYHYQTQPIANATAWYAHKLPLFFQKLSCLFMFAAELIVPFGIFFNEPIRLITFFILASLQWFIWLTGNFSYLNYLTLTVLVVLISNRFLEPLFGPAPNAETNFYLSIFLYVVGSFLLFVQVVAFANHFFPNRTFQKILNPLRTLFFGNRYGIFAVMTTKRYEIVVKGSEDGTVWKEYLFFHKASEITRRPTRVSPYQPRLDWQIWFLPFSTFDSEHWFQRFLTRLLEGEESVLKLIRKNPFEDKPPKYIKAVVYDYVFSDKKKKKETKAWWERTYIGRYTPTLTLKGKDNK
ncbi:lipase maturation factor family protein [Criblamydia sequanensis]|uniref:Conserved putative membrane protein n=1 Tax=Candidatus Criblamydia sequanensis CRIB-18 TaxID=1437425 RepID=A0A090D1D2_9BACT|nr:lipase maturation factor family protein [Criblamydia sequanensis]CDR33478.1 Conserved putative membrane protein [Criblamydia sequanensis CRIB-18]